MANTATPPGAAPAHAFHDLLQRATTAFAHQRHGEARALLHQAAALQPQSIEVVLWSARLAERTGDWSAALEAAGRWSALEPASAEAIRLRARSLLALQHWEQARTAWDEVLKQRPGDLDALAALAAVHAAAGDMHAAQQAMLQARDLAAGQPRALARLADAALKADLPAATQLFQALAAADPAGALAACGHHLASGEHLAAAALLEVLDDGSAAHAQQKTAVGDALVRQAVEAEASGRHLDACRSYCRVLQLEPADAIARMGRERCVQALKQQARQEAADGRQAAAEALLAGLQRLQPEDGEVDAQLAGLLARRGEWERAGRLWAASPRGRPSDAVRLLGDAAQQCEAHGRYADAARFWAEVGRNAPAGSPAAVMAAKFPARVVRAGRAALEAGQLAQAGHAFAAVPAASAAGEEAARRLEQLMRLVLRDLRAAYKEERFGDLLQADRELGQLFPHSLEIARLAARAAMKLRDYPAALAAWLRARAAADDSEEVHVGLARCCHALRRRAEAREHALAALRINPANAEAQRLAGP